MRRRLDRPVILTNQTEDEADGLAAIDDKLVKATCNAISNFVGVDDLCYEIYTFAAPHLEFELDKMPGLGCLDSSEIKILENPTPWWVDVKVADLPCHVNIKISDIERIIRLPQKSHHACSKLGMNAVNVFRRNQHVQPIISCECGGYSWYLDNDDVVSVNVKDITNPYFIQCGLIDSVL